VIVARYEQIEGESRSDGHKGWIDIAGFTWGAQPAGEGRLARGAVAEAFTLMFAYEKAAPQLEQRAFTRTMIRGLQVEAAAPGPQGPHVYLRYEFEDVTVSAFHVDGSTQDGRAVITVVNTFRDVKVTYTEHDAQGATGARTGYTHSASVRAVGSSG
jgi:type VI secretion system secreted protein Hcp